MKNSEMQRFGLGIRWVQINGMNCKLFSIVLDARKINSTLWVFSKSLNRKTTHFSPIVKAKWIIINFLRPGNPHKTTGTKKFATNLTANSLHLKSSNVKKLIWKEKDTSQSRTWSGFWIWRRALFIGIEILSLSSNGLLRAQSYNGKISWKFWAIRTLEKVSFSFWYMFDTILVIFFGFCYLINYQ